MSGTMSKYIIEDEDVECLYPDISHCPIKCMSRSYAHLFMRFQDLEQSIREMKNTLDTVLDYIIREVKSSSSSDSDRVRDKKKAKNKAKTNKSRNGSRSGSEEPNIDQDLLDAQATLESDFTQLLTWKDSDDEGGKPKKSIRCQVISCLKSKSTSSNDGDTSELETSDDPGIVSEAGEIVRKVSKVIDNMAKVVGELQVTAGMAVQVAADAAELQSKENDNAENGSQSEVDEDEEEEEENSESEFVGDFMALYNEMNEVD